MTKPKSKLSEQKRRILERARLGGYYGSTDAGVLRHQLNNLIRLAKEEALKNTVYGIPSQKERKRIMPEWKWIKYEEHGFTCWYLGAYNENGEDIDPLYADIDLRHNEGIMLIRDPRTGRPWRSAKQAREWVDSVRKKGKRDGR